MADWFEHKPRNTLWISCELFVVYGCDDPPEVDELVITGIKQFGFIFSHEYDIKAFVEEPNKVDCKRAGCDCAKNYEFDVRFFVREKIGLGFGLGAGTGTAGWTTRSTNYVEKFMTRCICCDGEDAERRAESRRSLRRPIPIRIRPPEEVGVPVVVAFTALATGVALSLVHSTNVVAQGFLGITGLLTALSFIGILRRRMKKEKAKHDRDKPRHEFANTA